MPVVTCGNHLVRYTTDNTPDIKVDHTGFFLICLLCDHKMRLSFVSADRDSSFYDVRDMYLPCIDPKTEMER